MPVISTREYWAVEIELLGECKEDLHPMRDYQSTFPTPFEERTDTAVRGTSYSVARCVKVDPPVRNFKLGTNNGCRFLPKSSAEVL